MKSRNIITADLDNILFENREKDYGAYQLRKNNRRYLTRSALIAFLLFVSGTALPKFVMWFHVPMVEKSVAELESTVIDMVDAPDDEPEKPEIIIEPQQEPQVIVTAFVAPEPDRNANDTSSVLFNDDINNQNFGFQTVNTGNDDDIWEHADRKRGKDPVFSDDTTEVGDKEFQKLDKDPQPINMDEITKLIGYPEMAKAADIYGKVVVRIYLDKTGSYIRHKVLKDPHPILTNAVNAQLSKLKFTPGIYQNKPLKTWVTIPFDFILNKN